MSRPFQMILPAVGSSSRSKARPSVVLPQPDSPTSATHLARTDSSDTPSTARN
jgi:hypothetical protein